MKTKKYIEDEAKNKLGLVNSDEILIKPKEKDDY
jgi:cell division protein FtsB